MSDTSNEGNQPPSDSAAPNSTQFVTQSSGSNALFIRLGILVVLAVAAYFAIPAIMTQVFYQEEVAKQKVKNIVGNDSDKKPPPGVQVYGQPPPKFDEEGSGSGPAGGAAGGRRRPSGDTPAADDGAKADGDAKKSDDK